MVLPIPAFLLTAASSLAGLILRSPLGEPLIREAGRGSFGPSVEDRENSQFEILCTAIRGDRRRRVVVSGRDPYGLTATIAAYVASLLHEGNLQVTGAVSPSMVAGARGILAATSAAGVSWTGDVVTA